MDGVQHYHSLGDAGRICLELPARTRASPHFEARGARRGAGAGVRPRGRTLSTFGDIARKRLAAGPYLLSANTLIGVHLLVVLDYLLQVGAHVRDWLTTHLHLAPRSL